MKFSTHITLKNGQMVHLDIEAQDSESARFAAIATQPRCSVESVCAWPIREPRQMKELIAVPAAVVFDSAFGCLA
jgi:hypothetical protein